MSDESVNNQNEPQPLNAEELSESDIAGVPPLEKDLAKLQEERDALFDRLARVTADFKNAQRRLQQEKEQAVEYANTGLIKGLLPVIDSFERALTVDPSKSDAASILKGMQIVHDQMMKVLQSLSVEEIAPEAGAPFDPAHEQALMQQDDPRFQNLGEPVVTQLLQKGYTLRGRVLRPAQVAVSKTN